MHPRVKTAIDALHPAFEMLLACPPLTERSSMPRKGVYLFTEAGQHLYVGRSNNIPGRWSGHHNSKALHNSAAFAMLLAREETSIYATYKPGSGRATLMSHDVFRPAFDRAKLRIARMEFRAVEEADQTRQALLEIYVAVALEARYNDFGTH